MATGSGHGSAGKRLAKDLAEVAGSDPVGCYLPFSSRSYHV